MSTAAASATATSRPATTVPRAWSAMTSARAVAAGPARRPDLRSHHDVRGPAVRTAGPLLLSAALARSPDRGNVAGAVETSEACIHANMRGVNEPLRVVCIGGGLGAPTVMRGLRAYTADITGLIGVTDSGRSTGKVRIALDVPAPGD